ncbi:hypothetical protein IMSAG049_01621 [Clostridiales bacterium]|nr:hypothetical protein IMSAG049_01621 [Clostridiales bacterium]
MKARKKRKFNMFDFLVGAIVTILIAGTVYKFRGLDKTKTSSAMETVTYELKIDSLRDYAFTNLQEGDTLFDYTSGNAIGTIKEIEWKDAERAFYTIDGQTIMVPVENRYDAYLKVEAQATKSNDVYFVDKTYEICVNSKRKVYTKYADFTAVITDIDGGR